MLVDGVEERLDVHLALRTRRIRIDLDKSARKLLTIKRFRMKFGAVVEVKLARDGLDVRVQKHILTVQNYDWVNDVFQIAHLVCGDDDSAVLGGALLNWALDGMSRPFVGSSRYRCLHPSANANEI